MKPREYDAPGWPRTGDLDAGGMMTRRKTVSLDMDPDTWQALDGLAARWRVSAEGLLCEWTRQTTADFLSTGEMDAWARHYIGKCGGLRDWRRQ